MTDRLIPPSALRARLAAGERAVGTMIAELRQPSVVQLLANAGFDFAIVDGEHGAFSVETQADLCRAGVAAGVTPIVRVPGLLYEPIAQALDGGAQGVMVPRVDSAAQAAEAVRYAKYPPVGRRGSALARGATRFRGGDVRAAMDDANAETLVVIQIESGAALEDVDAIAAVPGVDVLFVGPNDLSIDLGVAGQIGGPVVSAAIERVAAACRAAGIWSAVQMNDVPSAVRWAPHVDLMSHSADVGLLVAAGAAAVRDVRAAWG